MDYMETVRLADPETIRGHGTASCTRQRDHLELIASENFVSPAVMAAMGSASDQQVRRRATPDTATTAAASMWTWWRIWPATGQRRSSARSTPTCSPIRGAQANMAVYFALLEPGDTVMGMSLSHGGHLTHGSPVNMSGKYFNFVPYGVSPETEHAGLRRTCAPSPWSAGPS